MGNVDINIGFEWQLYDRIYIYRPYNTGRGATPYINLGVRAPAACVEIVILEIAMDEISLEWPFSTTVKGRDQS